MLQFIENIPAGIKIIIAIQFLILVFSLTFLFLLKIRINLDRKRDPRYNLFSEILDNLFFKKKLNQAKRKFEALINQYDDYSRAHEYLGYCCYYLGDFKEALAHFDEFIKSKDSNSGIYRHIAMAHLEIEKNYTQALASIERYSRGFLSRGNYMESLCWIYYVKGDQETALKYFERIRRSYYRNLSDLIFSSDRCYHLGKLFFEVGDYENSKEAFLKATKTGGEENYFTRKSREEIERLNLNKKTLPYSVEELEEIYKNKYFGSKTTK